MRKLMRLFFLVSVFLLILFVYISTNSDTVYGGDSGDLLAAIAANGFAHPPGYPLYTLLGMWTIKILSFLPYSLAGKVIFISIFANFFSLILLYKSISELTGTSFNRYIAIIVIFVTAFNYLIWLYSIVPEVFALNSLLILGIFYSAIRFYKTKNLVYCYFLFLLIGLGITHHHTFILVLPSVIYLMFKRKTILLRNVKKAAVAALFFLIGITSMAQVYFASHRHVPFIWGYGDTFSGFTEIFLRKTYGTFVPGSFITQDPIQRLLQLIYVFISIAKEFSIIGIITFVLGLFYLFRSKNIKNPLHTALAINIFMFGPFFFFYANFPLYGDYNFATLERFFIIFYFFSSIAIYFGICYFYLLLKNSIEFLVKNKSLLSFFTTALAILVLVYPITVFRVNLKPVKALVGDRTAENLANDILYNAEKNSLILLVEDIPLFNTQYLYYSKQVNAEGKYIIHLSKVSEKYYIENFLINYPELKTKKNKTIDIVDYDSFINAFKDKLNIYSNHISYYQDTKDMKWVPSGILFKLVSKNRIKKDIEKFTTKLENFWKHSKNKNLGNEFKNTNNFKFRNYFSRIYLTIYSNARLNSADFLLQIGELEKALNYIKEAKVLTPNEPKVEYLLSVYHRMRSECNIAEKTITKALSIQNDQSFIDELRLIGETCYKDSYNKKRVDQKIIIQTKTTKTPLSSF